MRIYLTCFFLLLILRHGSTQSVQRYSLSIDSLNLSQTIDLLVQYYELDFSFSSKILESNKKISKEINQTTIENLLSESLQGYDIEYQLIGESTILLRKLKVAEQSVTPVDTRSLTIKGKIIDDDTTAPISYVAVAVAEHNRVSFTDSTGYFEMVVPDSWRDQTLTVHMLGYQALELTIQDLLTTTETLIRIKPKPYHLEEVSIIEKVSPIHISPFLTSIRPSVIQRHSLYGKDIQRSLQMLPGIDASDDDSAEIRIRGSQADETLIIMDGIPILNSSHYYGVFSAINADYVHEVDVYKNNQPIEYGQRTAGVVEYRSEKEIPESAEATFNLNFLESSISVRAPVQDKVLMNFSARSTIQNISNTNFNTISNRENQNRGTPRAYTDQANFATTNPEFNFYDIHSKLLYLPTDKSSVSFSYYRSRDVFENASSQESLINRDQRSITLNEQLNVADQWKNDGYSLSVNQELSPSHRLALQAHYSQYRLNSSVSYSSIFELNDPREIISSDFMEAQDNSNIQKGINLKLDSDFRKSQIETGIRVTNNITDTDFGRNQNNILSESANTTEISAYSMVTHALSPSVDLSGGLRMHYYTGTELFYWSPLLSAVYRHSDQLSFKSSIGKNHQFLRELSIETGQNRNTDLWIAANDRRIPVSSSINSMMGLSYKRDNITLDIELFHKDLDQVIEFLSNLSVDNDRMNRSMFNLFSGKGYSRGIDLLLLGEYGRWQSQLSYTLSDTRHSFDQINRGEYYPAQTDKRHQLNGLLSCSLKQYQLSASYIFSSGRPYLDNNKVLASFGNERMNISQRSLISLLPDYHRIDITVAHHFELHHFPATISVSVFNLLNRNNVKYRQQVSSLSNRVLSNNRVLGTNSDLLDRTFSINFSINL